ncbi:MAG: extracellular solute-binding protein [Clostridia bacterium]|nr:extracellular solute-binding protein [Clostridia bacterium]
MTKRILAIALVLMLALPAIAMAGEGEPVVVTAVLQINAEVDLENNPMIQYIEDTLNIRLIIEAPPPSGYGDRVRQIVAGGDMPDLVHFGADTAAKQWAEDGLLLELTDLIDQYPNMSVNHTLEQRGDCDFFGDGRIWGLPKANSYDVWGFLINKAWLDKVGKEIPTTVEEFVDVCRAFTFDDPNGNGQDDTYGVSFGADQNSMDSGIWHLRNDFVAMAYSIANVHLGMPDVDGSAKLRAMKEKYPEYIQLLRGLYEEGIIDREFVTHKSGDDPVEKFAQGRVGMVGCSGSNYTTNIIERYGLNPDDYVYCAPLVLEKGAKPQYAMPPSAWMAYYVNASSPNTEAVLRLLDWADSEEGFVMMQMGLAGLHYNTYDIETRTVDRTEEQLRAREKVTSNMFAFANAYNGSQALMGGSNPELIAKWQSEALPAFSATQKVYFPFTKMLEKIATDYPDEMLTLNSLEVRYVTGEATYEELDAYIHGDYADKTADIAQEFADYLAEHPARYED